MTLALKETKKLFYGKWIYKISLKIPGCAVLRTKTGEDLEYYLSALPFEFPANAHVQSLQAQAFRSKNTLIKLNFLLNTYNKKDYSKRIESDIFDVYTNKKNLIDDLQREFESFIRLISKPKTKNIDRLLKNQRSIFVSSLPKDKYEYRVYLKPHNVKQDKKPNFVTWVANQGDATTMSESLIEWFIKSTINWDRRYILVDNEKTLLMIKLHTPEAVGTVYKYEVVDK
jgi:hypothetical protein